MFLGPLFIYSKERRIRIWPDGMAASIPVNSRCNSSFTCNFAFPKEACLVFYFGFGQTGMLSLASQGMPRWDRQNISSGEKEMATALAQASCLSSANVLPLAERHFFPPTLAWMETKGKQNRLLYTWPVDHRVLLPSKCFFNWLS